jgi:exonuclease SbcD
MLKLFHTADWHLGHTLHGISRHYEHQQFLDWLLTELLARQIDVLIVAGDIFDSANPSAQAQTQLYEFLVKAKQQQAELDIILVGGNHDSANRLDAPSSILNALGIYVVGGLPRNEQNDIDWQRLLVPLSNSAGEVKAWCGAMPFLRNADLPNNDADDPLIAGVKTLYDGLFTELQNKAQNGESLLMTGHCYMVQGNVSDVSERKILGGNQHALPVDLFSDAIDYVALGHLHLAQTVGARDHVRYSGSPIPLSFDESHYVHSVLQVELTAGQGAKVTPLKIPRVVELLRIPDGKNFACLADILERLENLALSDLPEAQHPFVELRILLDKPEPSLGQQIDEVIADLPIRLLKKTTANLGKETSLAELEKELRLEELQPLQVFQQCYRNKYNEDAPETLTALFNELLEASQ